MPQISVFSGAHKVCNKQRILNVEELVLNFLLPMIKQRYTIQMCDLCFHFSINEEFLKWKNSSGYQTKQKFICDL